MTAGYRPLLRASALCATLVAFGACGTLEIDRAGNVTCEQLTSLARSTGPNYDYVRTTDISGSLPRTGLSGAVGKRNYSEIYVRLNASDPAVITNQMLRTGVVIAKVISDDDDKRLNTQGGLHYWAVAMTGQNEGISVMAPTNPNERGKCTPLYIKSRNNQLPYPARFLPDPMRRASLLSLLAYERAAEGLWEACGSMCCCAGKRQLCESHDALLQ